MSERSVKEPKVKYEIEPDVDISQIERNLSLTPEERLLEHQVALELAFALEAAGKALREKSQ